MAVEVIFEDNHLIAVYKQAGQTVQPEPGKPISLEDEVKAYIKTKYQKPGAVFLGVIHRLDMPVSGIVLFAKTSKALVRMNEAFKKRTVKKIYHAECEGIPKIENGLLEHYLLRDEHKNITRFFNKPIEKAEKAMLAYQVLAIKGKQSLLEIELLTGRKHQIRAQLSAIKCPILGDAKYGSTVKYDDGHIALKAVLLSFKHPVKDEQLTISIK
ncbi:MAG: RluA family pseudouridine synthase [Bacteroidota bacterium]|jgi:23S rRNA pseudouridine1911/1915/1917 synthase